MDNFDLTVREQKVANGILKGKSGPQSAFEAGYAPSYARKYRVAEHKRVKNYLTMAMKRRGIDEKCLAEVMADGLKANKTIVTQNGLVEVTDFSARHKYLETGLKVTGYLKDNVIQQEIGIILLPAKMSDEEWNREHEDKEAG